MRAKKILVERTYCPESIIDIEEDIMYALDDLPKDKHGFFEGSIEVTVTHVSEESPLPNHEFEF